MVRSRPGALGLRVENIGDEKGWGRPKADSSSNPTGKPPLRLTRHPAEKTPALPSTLPILLYTTPVQLPTTNPLNPYPLSGAGSFGHPQAKKYKINGGWNAFGTAASTPEEKAAFENVRYGFAATRYGTTYWYPSVRRPRALGQHGVRLRGMGSSP